MLKLKNTLKLYIFDFLEYHDRITLSHTCKAFKDVISLDGLEIFKALVKCKKMCDIDKKAYVNYFNGKSLITLFLIRYKDLDKRTNSTTESGVDNRLVTCILAAFFIYLNKVYGLRQFLINFSGNDDMSALTQIVTELTRCDYVYHLKTDDCSLYYTPEITNIFTKIKYCNIEHLKHLYIFVYLRNNEIITTIEKISKLVLLIDQSMTASIDYFQFNPNSLVSYDHQIDNDELLKKLVELNLNKLTKLTIPKLNLLPYLKKCRSLRKLKIKSPHDEIEHDHIRTIKKLVNLETFLFKDVNLYEQIGSNKRIKQIGDFPINIANYTKVIEVFNNMPQLASLKYIHFAFFDNKNLNSLLSKIQLDNLQDIKFSIPSRFLYSNKETFMKFFLSLKHLQSYHMSFSDFRYPKFEITKLFSMMENETEIDYTLDNFDLILHLMKNNEKIKRYNIACSGNYILMKLINFLFENKKDNYVKRITSLKLNSGYNTRRIRDYYFPFDCLDSLELENSYDFKPFKNVKSIHTLIFHCVDSRIDEELRMFLNAGTSNLTIGYDERMIFIDFLFKNVKILKRLNFFEIKDTKYLTLTDSNLIERILRTEFDILYFGVKFYSGEYHKYITIKNISELKHFLNSQRLEIQ